MSKLSLEDLSFFDPQGSSAARVQQPTATHNRPGSLADLGSLYGLTDTKSSQISHTDISKNNDKIQEDEDDFGDFVESENNSPQILLPQTFSQNEKIPSSSSITNTHPLSPPSNEISMQSQIKEVASFPTNSIRFGQHLVNKKGADGRMASKPSVTSSKQWNELLSSTPGPRLEPTPKASSNDAKPKQPSSANSDFLEEPWDSFGPGDDNLLDIDQENDTTMKVSGTTSSIPHSETLLIYIHENILSFIETKLLTVLAPLTYQLRKRVLAHSKTKQFLKGYLELLQVSNRIMVGRHRRALKETKSDREARQVERVWTALFGRVNALFPKESLPDLSAKVVFPAQTSTPLCPVCGLSKTEFIKGQPKPRWASEDQGHQSCTLFWSNRKLFNI